MSTVQGSMKTCWMFSGGTPSNLRMYLGPVQVERTTKKNAYLADFTPQSGYRKMVLLEEVYATEEECRNAAAARLVNTEKFLKDRIADMTRVVLGQPEKR